MLLKSIKNYFLITRRRFFKLINEKYPNYKSQFDIFDQLAYSFVRPTYYFLDAGCGRNPTLIKSKDKAGLVVGVDLESGIKSNNSLDFPVFGNITNLPFKSCSFNLATARNVIEHLEKPDVFFSEVSRVLGKNGKFIFITPNVFGFRTIMSVLIPNFLHKRIIKFIDGRDEVNVFPTYFKANILKALDSKLRKCGFHENKIIMFQGYLGVPFSITLTRFMILYERLINKLSFLKFLRSVIIGVYEKN